MARPNSKNADRVRHVMPVDFDRDTLILAMVDPLDVVTLDDVRVMTGIDVVPVVTTATGFADTVELVFSNRGALAAGDHGEASTPHNLAEDRHYAEDISVVAVVNDILNTALKRRASDIHFEPQLYEMGVRIRVDGVLHTVTTISNDLKGGVLSRLKIMGDMDIAEKRLPQDGRATYRSPDQTVDLRIASIPTVYGENITGRIGIFEVLPVTPDFAGLVDTGPRLMISARRPAPTVWPRFKRMVCARCCACRPPSAR